MKMGIRSVVLLLLLTMGACAPKMRITPGQMPLVEVPESNLKAEAEGYVAAYIDEQSYKEISSGAELKRITTMVERLTLAAGYPPRTFPVHLVDAGEEVNAAAFQGASIVVYRELLKRVPGDDELATVIGHEIGHIALKHYKDQEEEESRAAAVGIGSSILGAIASVASSAAGLGGTSDIIGDVTETTTSAIGYGAFVGSFNRAQEYEADHIGLLIMAKAGYDPRVAVQFWGRSEEVFGSSGSSVGAFFSTHPASGDRMKALEEAMPHALGYYEQATAAKASKPTSVKKAKAK